MDKAIIDLRTELLRKYFDDQNANTVMTWLIATEHRSPAVLVGAGFSRNARHKYRGRYALPQEVPLWGDVVEKMATHLGVSVHSYDAPTMADMYACSLGDGDLRDVLRDMLPDDELEPGDAHLALARYGMAACITTNLLDTLLDKAKQAQGHHWNGVVVDTDLSAVRRGACRSTDLIYFHGHRRAPDTWVMTRAQYEDIAKNKPVIVARVRQLLAQHPLLIVGFGLSDANFHNVYRQTSTRMRRRQPLGLAIQLAPVRQPERDHWFNLGLYTVVPRNHEKIKNDPEESDQFFSWLFRNLATNWSPNDDEVQTYLLGLSDKSERLKVFRGLLPHREPGNPDIYIQREADFSAWKSVLFSILDEQDQDLAKEDYLAASRYYSQRRSALATEIRNADTAAAPDVTPQVPSPKFKRLPTEGGHLDEDMWRLDTIFDRYSNLKDELAAHFLAALDLGLFRAIRAEAGFVPWAVLTFWLVVNASNEGTFVSPHDVGRKCIRFAGEYVDTLSRDELLTIARKHNIGLADDELAADKDDPTRPELSALHAALQGNVLAALEGYSKAAEMARAEGDEFKEWCWLNGELFSLNRLMWGEERAESPQRSGYTAQSTICAERIRVLEGLPLVRSWVARADRRAREALLRILKDRNADISRWSNGDSSFSFGAEVRNAWRSVRDLQNVSAHPLLIGRYLEPVLLGVRLPARTVDELDIRLVFDPKSVATWVEALVEEPCGSVEAQQLRDKELVAAFWGNDENETQVRRVGQLLAFPKIREALAEGDEGRVVAWLGATMDRLGLNVETYESSRTLSSDYASAMKSAAHCLRSKALRVVFLKWWDQHEHLRDDLAQAAYSFPWERWALEDDKEARLWIDVFTRSQPGTEERARIDESWRAFALYRVALALSSRGSHSLQGGDRETLGAWAEALCQLDVRRSYQWESRRAGYWLERTTHSGVLSPLKAYEKWSTPASPQEWAGDDVQALQWSLCADAVFDCEGTPEPAQALVDQLQKVWSDTQREQKWEQVYRRYELNPHMAIPLVRFLAGCLNFLPEHRHVVSLRLTSLVRVAPHTLSVLGNALEPEMWQEQWDELVGFVGDSLSGRPLPRSDGVFGPSLGSPTSRQLTGLGLITGWISYRGPIEDDPLRRLPAELRELMLQTPVVLASDSRTLVANHAAYAIVALAEHVREEREARQFAGSLRRLAMESRVAVRRAAAYAGGKLAFVAKAEAIREAAREIGDQLGEDASLGVQTQLQFGRLEGECVERNRRGV